MPGPVTMPLPTSTNSLNQIKAGPMYPSAPRETTTPDGIAELQRTVNRNFRVPGYGPQGGAYPAKPAVGTSLHAQSPLLGKNGIAKQAYLQGMILARVRAGIKMAGPNGLGFVDTLRSIAGLPIPGASAEEVAAMRARRVVKPVEPPLRSYKTTNDFGRVVNNITNRPEKPVQLAKNP